MRHTKRLLSTTAQRLDRSGDFLGRPTWSVKSLLPKNEEVTSKYLSIESLNHLHALSALPKPTPEAAPKLLKDLRNLIHFVHHVKTVDVGDIEPLTHIYPEALPEDITQGVRTTLDSQRLAEWKETPNDEKGLSLLDNASKKHVNWYMVEKQRR